MLNILPKTCSNFQWLIEPALGFYFYFCLCIFGFTSLNFGLHINILVFFLTFCNYVSSFGCLAFTSLSQDHCIYLQPGNPPKSSPNNPSPRSAGLIRATGGKGWAVCGNFANVGLVAGPRHPLTRPPLPGRNIETGGRILEKGTLSLSTLLLQFGKTFAIANRCTHFWWCRYAFTLYSRKLFCRTTSMNQEDSINTRIHAKERGQRVLCPPLHVSCN